MPNFVPLKFLYCNVLYFAIQHNFADILNQAWTMGDKVPAPLFSDSLQNVHHFSFKGSDPRAATCRGKLQTQRSKLNMQINKELMLRSGAENLFK